MKDLNLLLKDYLLMPFTLFENHWALLIFCPTLHQVFFFNTIPNERYSSNAQEIVKSVGQWMKNTFNYGNDFEFKTVKGNIQPNTFDCGVYTIHYCIEFLKFSKDRQFEDVLQFLNDRVIIVNHLNIPIIFECNQFEIKKLRAQILNLSQDTPRVKELRNLRFEARDYASKVRFNTSYMY